MSESFLELAQIARRKGKAFEDVSPADRLKRARRYVEEERARIRALHNEGASGADVVAELTELADRVVIAALDMALYAVPNRRIVLQSVSLSAQGGYGRAQLNPYSDLDLGLLYEGAPNEGLRTIDKFLSPFLFDIGYANSCVVRSVKEAADLAKVDTKVFTSYLECRLLAGSTAPYARLRLLIRGMRPGETAESYAEVKLRERSETLAEQHRELYAREPNVKEGAGGLRDYHAALWLLTVRYGITSLDQATSRSVLTAEERLELAEALDLLWRVRNELHFLAGKPNDRLGFAQQRAVAEAFGYADGARKGTERFMEDYYAAARRVRRFLRKVARNCDYEGAANLLASPRPGLTELAIEDGELYAGHGDPQWFLENPARLMAVYWECTRRGVDLSPPTEQLVEQSLHLVNDTFRSSDLVRRYFFAICNRPLLAGRVLRQAAHAGLLAAYLPEFAAIQDIIRYPEFHSYPVDEHTIRAIEALAALETMEGPVAGCLQMALQNLSDPCILVIALLCHDIGKADGERHVDEGVVLTKQLGERIGIPESDLERITFLVQHHMIMSDIALYRDTDDEAVITAFAKTIKTEERLRALFVLTYADLSAVGPTVWNDWKGALLQKLYLRTEKVLLGQPLTEDEEFWKTAKAQDLKSRAEDADDHDADDHDANDQEVERHIRELGERYFNAFSPEEMIAHMACIREAETKGLAMRCDRDEDTGMSQVVICTRDRAGLFAEITGCFATHLIDVNSSALYTRKDGMTIDCFTVVNATRRRPLTTAQFDAVEKTLRAVLVDGEDVEEFIDQAQRRLFGLMQAPVPVPTRIEFDNDSSATHTVLDVQSGDRTGILYSIAKAVTESGLDIANARIVTDAHRVRDSFYVTQHDAKLKDKETQAHIAEAIREAIHPRPALERKGDTA